MDRTVSAELLTPFGQIRAAMASFNPSPRVSPNEVIEAEQVFMPRGHRAVLDPNRQLVVGNRGMGKSFWTHALSNRAVRERFKELSSSLVEADVHIGFNGSHKISDVAPSVHQIAWALSSAYSADEIWRAVILRSAMSTLGRETTSFEDSILLLRQSPSAYGTLVAEADDHLASTGRMAILLFDALDLLARDWKSIRELTSSLLRLIAGLRSFRSLRAKVFMRPDQFLDRANFQFPDASKIRNDHVDLTWQPTELFSLLFFEIQRSSELARRALERLALQSGSLGALDFEGRILPPSEAGQALLVTEIAGQYMGSDARRGKVYTWVPLHLSDARGACSPRTFLAAWSKAATHLPAPQGKAVDHLGLIEGVKAASLARLEELREDYQWIDVALGSLRGQFVPMEREEFLKAVGQSDALTQIRAGDWLPPIELQLDAGEEEGLLSALSNIGVAEERANGRINIPDIFRVEAGIKRKGGVAVPKRSR